MHVAGLQLNTLCSGHGQLHINCSSVGTKNRLACLCMCRKTINIVTREVQDFFYLHYSEFLSLSG